MRELKDDFIGLVVGHHASLVLASGHDQIWIAETPRDGQDASLVDVGVLHDWVLGISEVPDVEAWVLVIVICNHELSGDLRVPHHLDLFALRVGLVIEEVLGRDL